MSKYIVEITGRYRKLITVEAESEDDAWDAAYGATEDMDMSDAAEYMMDMEYIVEGESNEDELMAEILKADTKEKIEDVRNKLIESKHFLPDDVYGRLIQVYDAIAKPIYGRE